MGQLSWANRCSSFAHCRPRSGRWTGDVPLAALGNGKQMLRLWWRTTKSIQFSDVVLAAKNCGTIRKANHDAPNVRHRKPERYRGRHSTRASATRR